MVAWGIFPTPAPEGAKFLFLQLGVLKRLAFGLEPLTFAVRDENANRWATEVRGPPPPSTGGIIFPFFLH